MALSLSTIKDIRTKSGVEITKVQTKSGIILWQKSEPFNWIYDSVATDGYTLSLTETMRQYTNTSVGLNDLDIGTIYGNGTASGQDPKLNFVSNYVNVKGNNKVEIFVVKAFGTTGNFCLGGNEVFENSSGNQNGYIIGQSYILDVTPNSDVNLDFDLMSWYDYTPACLTVSSIRFYKEQTYDGTDADTTAFTADTTQTSTSTYSNGYTENSKNADYNCCCYVRAPFNKYVRGTDSSKSGTFNEIMFAATAEAKAKYKYAYITLRYSMGAGYGSASATFGGVSLKTCASNSEYQETFKFNTSDVIYLSGSYDNLSSADGVITWVSTAITDIRLSNS